MQQGALWRDVILLAVGRLVYLTGDTDKPQALVGAARLALVTQIANLRRTASPCLALVTQIANLRRTASPCLAQVTQISNLRYILINYTS
ncbi:MAG: hypothetical protein ONB16_10780 [candidate division KSB1 bacterium]|nr:hypothetical protein [candidate division KSB1 bacterium]